MSNKLIQMFVVLPLKNGKMYKELLIKEEEINIFHYFRIGSFGRCQKLNFEYRIVIMTNYHKIVITRHFCEVVNTFAKTVKKVYRSAFRNNFLIMALLKKLIIKLIFCNSFAIIIRIYKDKYMCL